MRSEPVTAGYLLDRVWGRRLISYALIVIFWLVPAWAAAQYVNAGHSDRLSVMQVIMPVGAICKNLDWEPASYCRHHSKGATLEIWTGAYGPGAALSFDAVGNEGLALIKTVKTHFLLAGIPIEALNQCIHRSIGFHLQVAGSLWDVHCHLVEIHTSYSLEIFPAPQRRDAPPAK
jgi:hypothetical protein